MAGSRWIGPFLVIALLCASAPVSTAQDWNELVHDLAAGPDFRLRVGAALTLGRSTNHGAVEPLVRALDDVHPAVRAAAAAALGALGDRSAGPGLRVHLVSESSPSVKAQIKTSLDKLFGNSDTPAGRSAKMLVSLGQMRNNSGVRGSQLADVLRGATQTRAAELPGVELVNDYEGGRREARARKLPLLVLDGAVNRLAQGAQGTRLSVSARVEYVVRKAPEQDLKGSVSGSAQAFQSTRILQDKALVLELEDQALTSAVDSAMRGAPTVLQEAVR